MNRPALALTLIISALGCSGSSTWSGRIVSKEEGSALSVVSPHAGRVKVLIIDGKRFERVRGLPPFYLRVPGMEAVLFVVDENDYSITYHVVNMQTRQDIAIRALSSVFGPCIGATNQCDTIEEATPEKIVLCDKGSDSEGSMEVRINLDLKNRCVAAETTSFFDKAGKLIRKHEKHPPF